MSVIQRKPTGPVLAAEWQLHFTFLQTGSVSLKEWATVSELTQVLRVLILKVLVISQRI